MPDSARDDKLDFSMKPQILQSLNRGTDTGKCRLTDMFDKDTLVSGSATLHAIKHNHVSASFNRKRCVKIRACATNLDINQLFLIGDFT